MTTTTCPPFHLAIPVRNLSESRAFYGQLLGCSEGRSAPQWIDFNFFGHQLVTHLVESSSVCAKYNHVDGDPVPVPHFGVVLGMNEWQVLADKLVVAGIQFVVEPHIRFKGQVGEQATMFLLDPSGNALEFKAFEDVSQLFAK